MPQSTNLKRLERVLGAPPPDALAELTSDDIYALADLIENARLGQQERLQVALTEALGYLPRMLRKPVRRVLFPEYRP